MAFGERLRRELRHRQPALTAILTLTAKTGAALQESPGSASTAIAATANTQLAIPADFHDRDQRSAGVGDGPSCQSSHQPDSTNSRR